MINFIKRFIRQAICEHEVNVHQVHFAAVGEMPVFCQKCRKQLTYDEGLEAKWETTMPKHKWDVPSKNQIKIVSYRQCRTPYKSAVLGGPMDGVEFEYVIGATEDGRNVGCWITDAKPGQYFKQTFIPWAAPDDFLTRTPSQ